MVSGKEKGMAESKGGTATDFPLHCSLALFGFCIMFTCYLLKINNFTVIVIFLQPGSFAEVTQVCCLDFWKMEIMLATTLHDPA